MGALYEALTRNQNLAPVADAIKSYVQKKKDEEKLQNFLRLMEQNKQKVNDLYKAPDETTYQTAPVPQNNFLNRLRTDNIGQPPQGMQLDVNNVPQNNFTPSTALDKIRFAPNPKVEAPVQKPDKFNLQDIGNVTTQTKPGKLSIEQLRNADKEANNLIIDTIMQGAKNELTPEQQQQAINMIELIKQGNQPIKPTYQKVGKGDSIVSIGDDGKVNPVYHNLEQGNSPVDTKIDEYVNGKGKRILIFQKPSGVTYEKEYGDVRDIATKFNIDNTSVAEAMRKMNIATIIGKLTKSQDDYAYYDKISKDPKATPEDKIKAEEQKQIFMRDIKQNTDELTQGVAQQFPFFYPTIQKYLSDPELIADPSKIDSVISEDMKGQEPNLILLTKNIVKARLFK